MVNSARILLGSWGALLVCAERAVEQGRVREKPECSCDCCGVAIKDNKSQCAPISLLTNADEDLHKRAAICPEMCASPLENDGSFLSSTQNVIDATRYCISACSPVVDTLNSQCVDTAEVKNMKPRITREQLNALVHHAKVEKTDTSHEMSIAVAKAAMLVARSQAVVAGEAAKRSKMAYEMVRRSAREAAEEAGRMTLGEIKREASHDATKAKKIRERYEASAIANADKAALNMAKMYKNAMLKARGVAGTWGLRASEYGTAAAQRKQMSIDLAKDAHSYMATKEYKEAQDSILQSQQAMRQAQDFAAKAASAHKTATEINDSLSWYTYAEYASAMNALAASTPLDIPTPPLPPLP